MATETIEKQETTNPSSSDVASRFTEVKGLDAEPETETVAGEESGTSTTEEVESQPSEGATESTEDANWLPDEQAKDFSAEDYERYAQRYKLTPEEAADPRNRLWLKDKINSDIEIKNLRAQIEQPAEETQEAEEVKAPEPTVDAKTQAANWFRALDQYVEQKTDPAIAQQFHSEFLKAFGVDPSKAKPEQALAFTKTMSKYGINLLNQALPDLLAGQIRQLITQEFPGFDRMHERSSYALAWDDVRTSSPEYSRLPAYGTPQFQQTMVDAATKLAGSTENFDAMIFTKPGANGTRVPLSPMENSQKKYSMLAKIAIGQQVKPAEVTQAVETGKRLQSAQLRSRQNANLGAGQSKGQIAPIKTGNDDIFGEGQEIYNQLHRKI